MLERTLIAVFGLTFCSAAAAQAPVARDSAGVHIVENVAPIWTRHAAQHLDMTPVLSVGSAMGAPEEQFGEVRGATRLSNGDIVVADRLNYQLRVFGPDGKFIRRIGRRGQGPGDLQGIWSIYHLPGDVILVWDITNHRLTWFASDGKVRKTLNVDHPPPIQDGRNTTGFSLFVVGPLADGDVIAYRGEGRINPPAGMYSNNAYGWRIDIVGHLHQTISLLHGESWEFKQSGYIVFDDDPYTARSSMVTVSDGFWYTDGVSFELKKYSPNGKLLRIVRERRLPDKVTPAEEAAYRKVEIDEAKTLKLRDENGRAALVSANEAAMKWLPFPERKAAFDALQADPQGGTWAREFGDSTATERWDHFDPNGRLLGEVDFPAGLDVFEIGNDYVLGRVKDENDVDVVRLYRLKR
ncbi:MAG: 6-bladed beta-propeller [Gemmatimonadales bacterium]